MKRLFLSFVTLLICASVAGAGPTISGGVWENATLDASDPVVALLNPLVNLPLTSDLVDAAGELDAATFSRASASTGIDPSTGLLKQYQPDLGQLIPADSVSPVAGNSTWESTYVSFDTNGGIIPTTNNGYHYIKLTNPIMEAGTYFYHLKVKAGAKGYVRINFYNANEGSVRGYFNITTGEYAWETVQPDAYYVGDVDEDGYRHIGLIHTMSINSNVYVYLSGSMGDAGAAYVGDGVNPDIYVKDINLVELPSTFVLGPELISNGTFDTDTSGWTAINDATLSSVSGGQSGNALEVECSGTANPYASAPTVNVEVGKRYLVTGYWKNVDATAVRLGSNSGDLDWTSNYNGTSWASFSFMFTASTTTFTLRAQTITSTSGQSGMFDEISIKEIPSALVSEAYGPELDDNPTLSGSGGTAAGLGTVIGDIPDSWVLYAGEGYSASMMDKEISATGIATFHNRNAVSLVSGAAYRYTVTVNDLSAGFYVDVRSETNTSIGDTSRFISTAGTHTFSFVATSTVVGGFNINIPDGVSVKFDSVSIKEITTSIKVPDPILPTRGLGPELVTNGDFSAWTGDDPDDWSHSVEDANNYITEVSGACRLVSDGTYFQLNQNYFIEENTNYQISINVTDVSAGGIYLSLYGGTAVTEAITTTGTHTWIINSGDNTSFLIKRLAGATDVTFDSVSVKEITYSGAMSVPAEPVFEEDGLRFMGGSVVNLLPYSEDFSEWTLSPGVTLTAGQLDPSGNYGAYLIGGVGSDTDQVYYDLSDSLFEDGDSGTFSIFVKGSGTVSISAIETADDYTIHFYIGNVTLTSEWTRIKVSGVKGADSNPTRFRIKDMNGDTVYIFGANLTKTDYLAPYIPSHGAATAIAGESLSWPLTDQLKNVLSDAVGDATSEGTVILEFASGFNSGTLTDHLRLLHTSTITTPSIVYMTYTTNPESLGTYDQTTAKIIALPSFVGGDKFKFGVTWSKTSNLRNVGYKADGGSWSFNNVAYDGNFHIDSGVLKVSPFNSVPFHIKKLRFYENALPKSLIEDRF